MSGEKELYKKVEDWVVKEGISLEYFTASAYNRAGFSPFQGHYVKDKDCSREIDVLAHRDYDLNGSRLRLTSIAECKWSKEKPWIVFNSAGILMSNAAVISQTIASDAGSALMWYMAGDNELQNIELFDGSKTSGFSGRQAFSDGNSDQFYTAVQSVVSKTVKAIVRPPSHQDELKFIEIGFPLIIIDAPLFEINYQPDTDTVEAIESVCARLRWRGSNDTEFIVTLDIVTRKYLNTYLEKLATQFDTIAARAAEYFTDIVEFTKTGNPDHLKISQVSRGVGRPWFFTTRTRLHP